MALEKIGPFEVAAELARRRGVQIYKGYDPLVHRYAAVSLLSADWAAKSEFMTVVRDRVRAARALRHPNLARTLDFGVHEGQPYVAMEMLEGRDLARLAGETPSQPLAWKLDLIGQAAQGLQHAHDAGIMHGDLKPSRLLLLEDGTFKVLDLGIPPPPSWVFADFAGDFADLTYRSPEQLQGAAIDARSDVFSLGAVAYEFLTGEHPFGSDESPETRSGIIEGKMLTPAPTMAPLPSWLDNTLRRCLALDPGQRFQSCGEFAEALRAQPAEDQSMATAAAEAAEDATLVMATLPEVTAAQTAPALTPIPDAPRPEEARTAPSHVEWDQGLVAEAKSELAPVEATDSADVEALATSAAPPPATSEEAWAPEAPGLFSTRLLVWGALAAAAVVVAWMGIASLRSPEPHTAPSPTPRTGTPSAATAPPVAAATPAAAAAATAAPPAKPAATPRSTPDPRVASLIAEARTHAEANDWTSPPGHCALDAYVEALRLAPDSAEAKAGIASVAAFFIQRGRELKGQGDAAGAQVRLDKARKVLDTAGAAAGLVNLEELRRELEAVTASPVAAGH